MKLHQLMESHLHECSQRSLKNNLGDGFLVKHNRIFKNIRNLTLECGYQFDSNPSTESLVFPFSQLETILTSRKIPYLDNVSVIQNLLDKTNNQVEWDELTDGFRRNYLFHESCHAVARSLENQFYRSDEKLVQVMLEESFANTCELMAVIDAKDSVHQYFYELNSYTFLYEARKNLIRACENLGEVPLFQLLMICYFYANVLKKNLNPNEFDLILNALISPDVKVLSASQKKNLKALSLIPFTLDLRFRTHTTNLYLKLTGLRMNRAQLQSVEAPDSRMLSYTKHLAQLALQK
jgi:hypothetical protein